MRTFGVDRFTALLTLLGLLGASLILLRTAEYGAGLVQDSALYISVARNLLEGNGFVRLNGHPLRDAFPFFPLALAFVGLFGPDAVDAARHVNAAAFGLTIFVVTVWLRCRVQSRFLVVWAGFACALSISLAKVSVLALTEPLFILLIVLSLLALDRFLDTNRRSFLLLAATCAGMACLTRHIGVTLIGSGLLILLLQGGSARPARTVNAAIWSAVAVMPAAAWMSATFLLSGYLFAGRVHATGFSPLTSLHTAVGEISLWTFGDPGRRLLAGLATKILDVLPPGHVMVGELALAIATFLLIGIAAGCVLRRLRPGCLRNIWNKLAVALVFLLVYALFLAVYLPLGDVELATRFLAPMFPPFLFAVTVVLNAFVHGRRKSALSARSPAVRSFDMESATPKRVAGMRTPVLICCLCLWLVPQVKANYDHVRHWMEHGGGAWVFSSRHWANSEIGRHLDANPPDGTVLSTNDGALYLLTKFPQPYEIRYLSPSFSKAKRRLSRLRDVGDVHVVWFFDKRFWHHGLRDYDLADLASLPGMGVVGWFREGVILGTGGSPNALDDTEGTIGNRLSRGFVGNAALIVFSYFDVYLDRDGNRLVREKGMRGG